MNGSDEARAAAERRVRALLTNCYHPELPLNIADLGLVHAVELREAAEAPGTGIAGVPPRFLAVVELLPASDDEAAQAQLRAQVDNLLAGLPEVWRGTVRLLAEPVWTPARISPAGRRALGLDQVTPFPILNNRLR